MTADGDDTWTLSLFLERHREERRVSRDLLAAPCLDAVAGREAFLRWCEAIGPVDVDCSGPLP